MCKRKEFFGYEQQKEMAPPCNPRRSGRYYLSGRCRFYLLKDDYFTNKEEKYEKFIPKTKIDKNILETEK